MSRYPAQGEVLRPQGPGGQCYLRRGSGAWDLLGKLRGEPVYQLPGGAVRDELGFYATGARPDIARQLGVLGGKLPLHHGLAKGEEGFARNIAMLADVRPKVSPDFWRMLHGMSNATRRLACWSPSRSTRRPAAVFACCSRWAAAASFSLTSAGAAA